MSSESSDTSTTEDDNRDDPDFHSPTTSRKRKLINKTKTTQFRASRSTRSGRPGGQNDQDIFDGLPVRQWRFQDATVSGQDEAGQTPDVAIRGSGLWKEMSMPKGSEHYPPWSQQILREARLGRLLISPQEYSRGGFAKSLKEDDKENDADLGFDGLGEERRAKVPTQGFMAKRWLQTPKHMEEPEVEYLAKRRKGLSSMHGAPDSAAAPAAPSIPLRKTRVRRVDDQGRSNMWEVLVPEGHQIEGEVDEPGMAENLGISISRPTPGTVIAGLGVANDDGIVVASITNIPLVSVVSTPLRPRGPRRKARGGFRRGRGKKLGYGDRGGVSASAEALYATRDVADTTMGEADVTTKRDDGDADAIAENAGQEAGEEESEGEGDGDEEDGDEEEGEAEEDGEAEPDEDEAEGEADGDEDMDMDRDDDGDDDREEGEITPSPEPPDASELLSQFKPAATTTAKSPLAPTLPSPAIPVPPPAVEIDAAESAQADTDRSNPPETNLAEPANHGHAETSKDLNAELPPPTDTTPGITESASAAEPSTSIASITGFDIAEPSAKEKVTTAPRTEDLPVTEPSTLGPLITEESTVEPTAVSETAATEIPPDPIEGISTIPEETSIDNPSLPEPTITPDIQEPARSTEKETETELKEDDVHFPDGEVDLLGSLERHLEQQSREAGVEKVDKDA